MKLSTLTHRSCGHAFDVAEEIAHRVRLDLNGGRPRTVFHYRRDEAGKAIPKRDKDGNRVYEMYEDDDFNLVPGRLLFEGDEVEIYDNPPVVCPGCGKSGAHADFVSLVVTGEGRETRALSSSRDLEIAEYEKAGLTRQR